MSQAGMEKCAVLLLALGEDAAASVFKYLSPLEVNQLGAAMREMRVLPRERVQEVLTAWQEESALQTGFATDSERFLDDTLARALGPDRAQLVMRRLGGRTAESLKQLAWKEPAEVVTLLQSEPPQLVAIILSQLPHDGAAAVLELLPEQLRNETVLSMAHEEIPPPEVLQDIEVWVATRLNADDTAMTAANETTAARLLAGMSRGSAEAVLHAVDQQDAPLAARLRAHNLNFDDLLRVSLPERKIFLRNISPRTLLHALKGENRKMLKCVGEAMSTTAAQRLSDDLDTLGGLQVTDIQAAQDEAASILQRLAAEGAVSVSGQDHEEAERA